MRPCTLSRNSVSYALPLPVLNPGGVGLCWTMKLYQSMTQTQPSGPTSAMIGADHSSSLANRFHEFFALNVVPVLFSTKLATRCPVGSATKATRFQYSFGYARA